MIAQCGAPTDEILMSFVRLMKRPNTKMRTRKCVSIVSSSVQSVHKHTRRHAFIQCVYAFKCERQAATENSRSTHKHICVWLNSKNVGFGIDTSSDC